SPDGETFPRSCGPPADMCRGGASDAPQEPKVSTQHQERRSTVHYTTVEPPVGRTVVQPFGPETVHDLLDRRVRVRRQQEVSPESAAPKRPHHSGHQLKLMAFHVDLHEAGLSEVLLACFLLDPSTFDLDGIGKSAGLSDQRGHTVAQGSGSEESHPGLGAEGHGADRYREA